MSERASEKYFEVRGRAIGMLEAGKKQVKVARDLEVPLRTLERWWAQYKRTGKMVKGKSPGRPKVLGKIEKIIISKSVGKKRQSPRKLAARFTARGLKGSKDTIKRYLRKGFGLKPYHCRKIPLLTKKQIKDRLAFCTRLRHWTSEDWKQVVFTDESPFELYHAPNPKNDVVWSRDGSDVEHVGVPKFSPKVMVWGGMSFSGLTDLHIVPQGTNIDQEYYCTNILEGNMFKRMKKNAVRGTKFNVQLVPDMSEMIFQQDGARPHTALRTQRLLQEKIPNFWNKDMWPANSPDLSVIENLWAILGDKLEEIKPKPTNIPTLESALVKAWRRIPKETLRNLIHSMPSRVEAVYQAKGHFPVK